MDTGSYTVGKGGFPDVRKHTCLVVEVRKWGLSPIRTNFLVLRTKGIPSFREII